MCCKKAKMHHRYIKGNLYNKHDHEINRNRGLILLKIK